MNALIATYHHDAVTAPFWVLNLIFESHQSVLHRSLKTNFKYFQGIFRANFFQGIMFEVSFPYSDDGLKYRKKLMSQPVDENRKFPK